MPLGANKAAIMGVAGVSTADVVLLSSQTASADSAVTFNSSLITSTYKIYHFRFYNINPVTNNRMFQFAASTDNGSSYGVTKTSGGFYCYHGESDGTPVLTFNTDLNNPSDTNAQPIAHSLGSAADESGSGEMYLFNPSSTTYAKHYISRCHSYGASEQERDTFIGGYLNTTTAINNIKFEMASGDMDGTVKLWGIVTE